MLLRRTTGFVQSLLQLVGLHGTAPDFSTLSRRQRRLSVSLHCRGGTGPLKLLIDCTGIKAECEREWNARRHLSQTCKHVMPGSGRFQTPSLAKIHIHCTAAGRFATSREGASARKRWRFGPSKSPAAIGEAPMLTELLNQIPSDQDVGSVTAVGAYDTRKCHETIAARDAYTVIPPRKNAKPWKPTSAGAIARTDAVNAQRYLGRTVWQRWSGYHRRSRVERKPLGIMPRIALTVSGCIV